MGLLDASYSAVNTKKPRKSDRILPATELNARGLLDAATNVPIAGDALSGVLAAYDAAKGDYGSAAANALGVLPFVSAGMVKGTGKIADALNVKHGEKLDAYLSEGNKGINLSKIVVPKESRNSGVGTEFMNDLVSMADKEGKTLTLTPSSDFGGSKARLQEFYKRFGFVPNKGRTKDFEISEAMYRNPVEQPKIESGLLDDVRPMTEYEKRHEIARQNAVKMLGLPENNTAMDRARAMGYTTPAYHATRDDFTELKLGGRDERISGPAIWAGTDPNNLQAGHNVSTKRFQEGAQIMPWIVKQDRPMVLDNAVMHDWSKAAFANGDSNFPQIISKDAAKEVTKGGEYSSIDFRGDKIWPNQGSQELIVFKPENIRSRFAAFDPARAHEADMLGYADPRLLGLIGGGGLLGLGAYKANQE